MLATWFEILKFVFSKLLRNDIEELQKLKPDLAKLVN